VAFDKLKYDNEYKKKNKKLFTARINPDEMEELNKLLEKHNLSHSQFIRQAMADLKKDTKK